MGTRGLFRFLAVLCLLSAFALRATADSSAIAQGAKADGSAVLVENAWARATVEGQEGTGAYLEITAVRDARLVGVTSPLAREGQVHEMKSEGGRMTMRRIDALELPAGRKIALAPGHQHIMLLGLSRQVLPGERLPLVLEIEWKDGKRSRVPVSAEVRPLRQ